MTLEKLLLELNPSELDAPDGGRREYTVTMLNGVDISSNKDALSISPPGLAASENILLGISGMEADINVSWSIHDDGTDKANGTHSSTVVTLAEQVNYLLDVMHAPDFDAKWHLDHTTGAAFNNDDVFVEAIDIPLLQQGSPKWYNSTLRLREGSSI